MSPPRAPAPVRMCCAISARTACDGYRLTHQRILIERHDMAILRSLVKIGLVKKIYDQARKPENQARIKGAIASVKAKQAARSRRSRT